MKSIINTLLNVFTYFLSGFSTRNKRRVVFGAWSGRLYGDNAKYLFEYLLNEDDLELIWVGNDNVKDKLPQGKNVKFARKNSLKAYHYSLTAKYVFFTNGYTDLTKFNCLRKAAITQLWHGGGIKRILADSRELRKKEGDLPAGLWYEYKIGKHTFNKCDYFITSSEEREKNIRSAFRYFGIKDNSVIQHGQPRNDMLVNASESDRAALRTKFRKEFNLPEDKKIILYLPTFRSGKQETNFSFLDLVETNPYLKEILSDSNAAIVEKKHLKVANSSKVVTHEDVFYDLTAEAKNIDTQELLVISDMLITDYSGVYLDFLLLDRPIIHFAYDYEYYINQDRGLKYDIKEVAGGAFVEQTEDLIEELKLHLSDRNRTKATRDAMNRLMNSYEKGESCQHIVSTVFEDFKEKVAKAGS